MTTEERPLALLTMFREVPSCAAVDRICETVVWPELADQAGFLAERAAHVRTIVTASSLPFPGSLDDYPNLELLCFTGAGFSMPETDACIARGIGVSNVPASNYPDVADHALGLILSIVRNIGPTDRMIRAGGWTRMPPVGMSRSIRSMRFGILGLGAIGTAIAERLEVCGGQIEWWGPNPKADVRWPRAESALALARNVDALVVAVRADDSSQNQIDAEMLEALGPRGYLVNVSRGLVVDEAALIAALRNGGIAGAALDVFASEPTDHTKWADLDNLVMTPHIGGWAEKAMADAADMVSENLRRQFAGEDLLSPIPGSPPRGRSA